MKDLSIVIAHRGDAMGLWATVHSCFIELETSGLDFEFCICVNGEKHVPNKTKTKAQEPFSLKLQPDTFLSADTNRTLHFIEKAGRLGSVTVMEEDLSPPNARQVAAQYAQGKHLFFFDNHCLVNRDYFKRALYSFEKYGMDLLHSTTRFYVGEDTVYHYRLKLKTNFWAEGSSQVGGDGLRPYRIAAGGHGGFAVTAESWKEVGGYWDGFSGYAGEELTNDLQYWMRGKSVWLDPLMVHYHWAGRRPYRRHNTDDYYRNLMMSSHIIGGEESLWNTYKHFTTCTKSVTGNSMYDLMESAYYGSKKEADRLASVRLLDLNDLRRKFIKEQIEC